MKLQLALDDLKLDAAFDLTRSVLQYIDIIEIGTPFIYREGMRAVYQMKELFPEKEVLADMKIMDGGYYETEEALLAGADIVTILGVADDWTVKGCLKAALKHGKDIVADMICVKNIPRRIRELEELGVQGLAVHTGTDQQAGGETPMEALQAAVKHCKRAEIYVAGGIEPATAYQYASLNPQVLVVGSGITHSQNPYEAAKSIWGVIGKSV